RVVGSVFSGILLGVLLARTFSGFVGAHLGWRTVYAIAAVLIAFVCVFVQFFLPRSKPTAKLPYFSLLKSTVALVREHAALRESALFGSSAFCCFSAFWTTLVFLLEQTPYHYRYPAQAAGLPRLQSDAHLRACARRSQPAQHVLHGLLFCRGRARLNPGRLRMETLRVARRLRLLLDRHGPHAAEIRIPRRGHILGRARGPQRSIRDVRILNRSLFRLYK